MYSLSLTLYDSMLVDVTTVGRMDSVSSSGCAWRYIGSCVPFMACLVLILGCDSFGITMSTAMTVSMVVIAVWWVAASLPLIRGYVQRNHVDDGGNALGRLWNTIRDSKKVRGILLFLLAFFFYIDGVYTIIEMATAYGEAPGLGSSSLLMALPLTQMVAFPCCIMFGRLSGRFDSAKLILVCITGYMFITLFAVFMTTETEFWILVFMVGIFQGGIQALSRSHFSKIIPPEKSGEYFGAMDVFGKGASFMGTMCVSAVSQVTGNMSLGIMSLLLFFVVGLVMFVMSTRQPSASDGPEVFTDQRTRVSGLNPRSRIPDRTSWTLDALREISLSSRGPPSLLSTMCQVCVAIMWSPSSTSEAMRM